MNTAYAREKVTRLGLEDKVTLELRDYTLVEGSFDKIASIGTFEHVGIANYPTYFQTVNRLLSRADYTFIIRLHSAPGIASASVEAADGTARPPRRLLATYFRVANSIILVCRSPTWSFTVLKCMTLKRGASTTLARLGSGTIAFRRTAQRQRARSAARRPDCGSPFSPLSRWPLRKAAWGFFRL